MRDGRADVLGENGIIMEYYGAMVDILLNNQYYAKTLFLVVFSLVVLLLIHSTAVLLLYSKDAVKMFKEMSRIPLFGKRIFIFCVGFVAPYSVSTSPRIEKLTYDGAAITCKQHRYIENPFRSIHLAALVNLGELAVAIPVISNLNRFKARAIPISVSSKFTKKSTGLITVVSDVRNLSSLLSEKKGKDSFEYEAVAQIINSKPE
eukprot:TRINITY_DN1535_c0_g1_i1.p1 TRINITY_DN1535_c0_g1~~TRINITY_DN1535_c0_g1_i1.p1  ORF type:complete len:205 (-),score=39.70 TRINITY_DN1535_c0_g1_i1:130-744(-)